MERLLSNHAPDCRRWKKAWFQNPRQWLIQAGPCSTVGRNPQWETSFCVVYLESAGDHTSSKVSFDCFKRIMLKRCRQWLEEQEQLTIIRISMDTRQVVLNEDPRCKHDKYNRSQAATLWNSLYRNFKSSSRWWKHTECDKRKRTKSISLRC